jgi:hypothetical protein
MKRLAASLMALAMTLSSTPAFADNHFARGGEIFWSYAELSARSPVGQKSESGFSQNYRLWGKGPLFNPALGRLNTELNFTEGFAANQAVNATSNKVKEIGYSVRTNWLRPGIRKYVRLDAHMSKEKRDMAQATEMGFGPMRTVVSDNYGFSSGLSIPKLPVLTINRHFNTMTDKSSISPLRIRSTNNSERLDYTFKDVRFDFTHQASETKDFNSRRAPSTGESFKSGLSLNLNDIKMTGPGQFYVKNDYYKSIANDRVTSENLNVITRFKTDRIRIGTWKSHVSHDLRYQRNQLTGMANADNQVAIASNRRSFNTQMRQEPRVGRTNSVNPGRSATQTFGSVSNLFSNRVNATTNLTGSYFDTKKGGARLSDSARSKLDWSPRSNWGIGGELMTSGSKVQGGREGNRSHGLDINLRFPVDGISVATMVLGRSRGRDFASGIVNTRDRLTFSNQLNPMTGMRLVLSYNVASSRNSATPGRVITQNSSLQASYRSPWGMVLNAEIYKNQQSFSTRVTANYNIGKASLGLTLEKRTSDARTGYNSMTFFLRRRL